MNHDFSIEFSIEGIQNPNTKEYFKEVYQTFVNGNYRSSTVMLYSVLICDLVYKLRDLRDIYNDPSAGKILSDIEKVQMSNPKSPEWESKLVDFVRDRTSLLEASDIVAIESLQKYRHLSAHPVLNNADLLFSPNKETIQALIRNILHGILTNPPFFSNKIFDTLLSDLSDIKEKVIDEQVLGKYLHSRYFKNLKNVDLKKIFRSLWKIVFVSEDPKAIENININIKALLVLIGSNKTMYFDLIKNEPSYYGNITKDSSINKLIYLLSRFHEIYNLINEHVRLLIQGAIDKDDNLKLVSWFVAESFESHLISLKTIKLNNLNKSHTDILMRFLADKHGLINEYIDYVIQYFGEAKSFDEAQKRYDDVLVNFLDNLNINQINKLLRVANDNNQIYRRIGMKVKLIRVANPFDEDIDKSIYTNIYT